MAFDLTPIKALTFDVGGTVFDWHSTIRDEVAERAQRGGHTLEPAAFANAWRVRMFERLAEVRSGALPWMNADQLHRLALDDIGSQFPGFPLSPADKDDLTQVWHRLRVWPDFPAALEQLRSRYTVVVLTVLSWSLVVDSSKHNGLSWDGVLSCEFLGHYKPQPEAYHAGVRMLGLAPSQVMMVAAHPWDLKSAAAAGLSTAYVPRPYERGEYNPSVLKSPDFVDVSAPDFGALATALVG